MAIIGLLINNALLDQRQIKRVMLKPNISLKTKIGPPFIIEGIGLVYLLLSIFIYCKYLLTTASTGLLIAPVMRTL